MKPSCSRRAGFLAGWLGAMAAPLALGQPVPPADEPDDSAAFSIHAVGDSVTLAYQETIGADRKAIEKKGGFVNVMNNVEEKIGALGSRTTAKVSLELELIPRLARGATSAQPSVVTLEVREKKWSIDSDLSAASSAQAGSDRAAVMAQLGAWKRTLTPAQLEALDRGETLTFSVVAPLAAPVLLSKGSAKVSLAQEPKAHVVSIAVRAVRGGGLTVGAPAIVEVTWDHPYRRPACRVQLGAGGRELVLAAVNTGNDLVFRSAPFLPYPAEYDEGLPTPGETDGGNPVNDATVASSAAAPTALPAAPAASNPGPGPVRGARPVEERGPEPELTDPNQPFGPKPADPHPR